MAATEDLELLAAAQRGDEAAFERLVAPLRRELHVHCYRMLGSVHDAEDALQDALLRAWRGLPRFQRRSSVRAWLYKIATNACLDAIGRRPKRELPIEHGPAAQPSDSIPGMPLAESVWVEPYPDKGLGLEDGYAAPEARYEQREAVELAFIAAIQHLPANQRAALILRDVLGYSAREVADSLDTTTQSVNSALQRARKTVDDKLPERSQQATLRALGDERLRKVVDDYMSAMQRGDVEAVVAMLADEAAWSMPPAAAWFGGIGQIRDFLRNAPLSGEWDWSHRATFASGQAAVGSYAWHPGEGAYLAFALDVLTLDGDRIAEVTSFITRTSDGPDPEFFARWPDHPFDPARIAAFERFGLPARFDR
jgi:RNA polymerase sigma-70 factor (ECF subfamily)